MKILLTSSSLSIELDEKDIFALSEQYSVTSKYSFSLLDDECFKVSLKMDSSNELCLMFEDNELIIFLPFNDFERWIHSEDLQYKSEQKLAASSKKDIIIRKSLSISSPQKLFKPIGSKARGGFPEIPYNPN